MPSGIVPPLGQGTHYGDTSVVTDVTDIIFQITPEQTPFFHICDDKPASVNAPWHQWQRRELTVAQDNAQYEGFNYTFTSPSRLPTLDGNVLQIFAQDIRISNTNQAIGHYGIPNMRADQVQVQLAELKTHIELALLKGTLATGATGTARRLNGIIPQCMSSVSMFTNASSNTFSESRFNGMLEQGWTAGAALRDVFVDGRMKRMISTFTGSAFRAIAAEDQKVVTAIDVIYSDFGPVNIHLGHPSCIPTINTGTSLARMVLAVDKTHLAKAWLRPIGVEPAAKIADSTDYMATGELTFEWGHRLAHFLYWNTSSSI